MMYRKISNIAEKELIEKELGVTYKYPKLYTTSSVIDGTEESTLSVVTSENPNQVSYAIWGILPTNYTDEWSEFQKAFSTLSVHRDDLNSNKIFQEPYRHRRCIIIITGFFIYHLHEGSLYPYYVYLNTKKPLYVAGVYNTLDDGFITCSMVMTKATGVVDSIQNLNNTMPLFVSGDCYNTWLDSNANKTDIDNILYKPCELELKSHPIAKEFFKNDIEYDAMLEPVLYKDIPRY